MDSRARSERAQGGSHHSHHAARSHPEHPLLRLQKVWPGEWPEHLAMAIVVALANGALSDDSLIAKMHIAVQELGQGEIASNKTQKILDAWIDQKWPTVVASLTQQPVNA